jgi:hypothetical protein
MVDSPYALLTWLAGALLLGIVVVVFVVVRLHRLRARRRIAELFKEYYRGDMPVERLGQRVREVADRRFIGGAMFYSVAAAAFQGAAGKRLAPQAHTPKDESTLLRLWAAAQNEFGLTDRYRIEAPRPGRE